MRSTDLKLPGGHLAAGLRRGGRRAERRRRDRRDPGPAPASGADRRGRRDRGARPGQGRGRRPPVQRRPALPGAADARARDAARDHGAPGRARGSRRRRASGGGRAQRHRRQAGRAPAAAGERDRQRSATRTRTTSPRYTLDADVLVVAAGRAGVVTAEMVKEGAAVVDVGVNRTETGIVGDVDAGAAERRGVPHARPGRRRPDDDRDAFEQHGARGALSTGPSCVPRSASLTLAALHRRAAARCPGRRCLCRKGVWLAQGHRQVVLEREGLRLHRARRRRRRLRPLLGDCRGRLQVADRGSAGRVRGRAGRQGPAGCERPAGLDPFRNRK